MIATSRTMGGHGVGAPTDPIQATAAVATEEIGTLATDGISAVVGVGMAAAMAVVGVTAVVAVVAAVVAAVGASREGW